MGNTFFKFKQFTIQQEKCAMKVTTEACLLGAYIAESIKSRKIAPGLSVLDIGSGTGVLSLMLVQKNPSLHIEGLEIDQAAALQSQENFEKSIWRDNLKILPISLQDYLTKTDKKFDFIISNPPFYQDQLESINPARKMAHHSGELTFEELFQATYQLLKLSGEFSVLIPSYRREESLKLAEKHHLYLREEIHIMPNLKSSNFRIILVFSRLQTKSTPKETIFIREAKNQYSERFSSLLEDYYL